MQRTGRKKLAVVLTLALLLGLMQIAQPYSEKVAMAADIVINSTGDGVNYSVAEGKLTISKKGTYKLSSAVSIKQINVEAGASGSTLDLNGQTVTSTGLTACVLVSDNTSLTINATGGGMLSGDASVTYRVISIGDGGSVNLTGGTIKSNNHAGVTIGKGSTFTMSGGTITGCKIGVTDTGMNGKFVMESGSITENECGVEISHEATVELKGGSIKGNSKSGVHLMHAKVSLSGSIDVSDQSGTAPDFSFTEIAIMGLSGKASDNLKLAENLSTLVHSSPTKDGKNMELHENSRTGTDVTEKFKTASTSAKELYVVWRTPVTTQAPTATPSPSASAAPTGTPGASGTPAATSTPASQAAATISPVVNPTQSPNVSSAPSASPYPTLKPELNEELKTVYPDASEETIRKIVTYANENKISEQILLFQDTIFDYDNETDPPGASFGKLRLHIAKRANKNLLLKWTKLIDADGYILVGNHCNEKAKGKKYKLTEIAQPSKSDSSFVSKKVDAGALKPGVYYKYLIYAYKDFDGQKVPIAASVVVHGTTMGNKKNTVAKEVKVYMKKGGKNVIVKKKITIEKGKKLKLTFKEIPEEKNKTIRPHRPVIFESQDTGVFTAGAKTGVIRGIESGTAILYAYAQNGVYKKIKVIVK